MARRLLVAGGLALAVVFALAGASFSAAASTDERYAEIGPQHRAAKAHTQRSYKRTYKRARYAQRAHRRANGTALGKGFVREVRRAAGGMTTIHVGRHAVVVAASAAGKFKGFLTELAATGYPIKFVGGYRHTKIAGTSTWSKHASGLAIDVNQTSRNRVVHRFPAGVTAMAARWGLTHGAVWRHPDTGHFEVAGGRGHRYASRRHKHPGRPALIAGSGRRAKAGPIAYAEPN